MSGLSAKRQRANTKGDSAVPCTIERTKAANNVNTIEQTKAANNVDFKKVLDGFDDRIVREMLLSATTKSNEVARLVLKHRDRMVDEERDKIAGFDHYSKSYELGIEASVYAEETIANIRKQTLAHSSFGTKKSALETLRKIGKTIALGGMDEFGSEVISQLQEDGSPLESAMCDIVKEMKADERARMGGDRDWILKVKELVELGSEHDIYKGLNQMLRDLGVYVSDDEDEGEEEDGEESEEGSEDQTHGVIDSRNAGVPRRDRCRGCGCGHPRCSSCWGDDDDEPFE